jgi:surface protein
MSQAWVLCSKMHDPLIKILILGMSRMSQTCMPCFIQDARSFNQDISSWNTSNVTHMKAMFRDARSFNQDISSWNISNVSMGDMRAMFQDARSFNQDLSSWNFM